MTLAELKAWLEGYSASFVDGAPDADQWAEIQKRISAAQPLKLDFGPYGPRHPDTMTRTLDVVRPYYVGDPPATSGAPHWQQPPITTC